MSFWYYLPAAAAASASDLQIEDFEATPTSGLAGTGNWIVQDTTSTEVSAQRTNRHVTQGSFSWRFKVSVSASGVEQISDPDAFRTSGYINLVNYRSLQADIFISVITSAFMGLKYYNDSIGGANNATGGDVSGSATLSVDLRLATVHPAQITMPVYGTTLTGIPTLIWYMDNLKAINSNSFGTATVKESFENTPFTGQAGTGGWKISGDTTGYELSVSRSSLHATNGSFSWRMKTSALVAIGPTARLMTSAYVDFTGYDYLAIDVFTSNSSDGRLIGIQCCTSAGSVIAANFYERTSVGWTIRFPLSYYVSVGFIEDKRLKVKIGTNFALTGGSSIIYIDNLRGFNDN